MPGTETSASGVPASANVMSRRDLPNASPLVPLDPTIPKLQVAARDCKACDLWKSGTQTVFGDGAEHARVLFIGEQPGDREDIEGKPFVGPAGGVLDKAMEAAGIDRTQIYVTNAVKHFKWEPRGKRRIHKKPNAMEIAACRPWLDAEIAVVQPRVVVCLGATAAQALLGKHFRVTERRGEVIRSNLLTYAIMATVHPSSILRAQDDQTRHEEMGRLIEDLKRIAPLVSEQRRAA